MRKILSLIALVSIISLTGCIKTAPTLAEVNDLIARIDEKENVVVESNVFEKEEYKEYSNGKTTKSSIERNTKYTFTDNVVKVETEYYSSSSYGSSSSKTVTNIVAIYDFNSNVCYTSYGDTGMYEQTSISSSSWNTFDYKYETSLSTSFLSGFTGDSFKTSYEKEYDDYTYFYEIYCSSSNNLTYTTKKVYNDDYTSGYYSHKSEYETNYSITFKNAKISLPSNSKLLV